MKSTSRKTRKRKGCTAIRNDPELWERVKRSIKKGGWSARKSQLAVALYKKKGGTYKGPKKSCNSLSKWTREDWGYISKSNNKSKNKRKGRYLPKKVRDMLTPYEKRKENRLKGNKVGQKIPYSKSVLKKIRKVL
jgi:hypothetical protein